MLPQNCISYHVPIPDLLACRRSALLRHRFPLRLWLSVYELLALSQSQKNLSHLVSYHLPEVGTMTWIIIELSAEYITVFIVTQDIYHNSQRSQCGCSGVRFYLGIPFMTGVPVTRVSTAAPCPPPCCISNKFLHHHCHIDGAEEGNMLRV